ncbi:MAG: mechanosensitive ion channel family protein, partial [Planctomycetes bacterium]|nr:mechanosensitive ion channel family protein [Planctomycetota bacterium]
ARLEAAEAAPTLPAPEPPAEEHRSAVGEIAEVVAALSGGAIGGSVSASTVSPATAATAATSAAPAAATPEAAEQARYLRERERERQTQLAHAEELVHSADERLRESLPYPLNLVFGVSFLGITLWRYLAALAGVAVGVGLLMLLRRHFRASDLRLNREKSLKGWRLVREVFFLALRSSSTLFVIAILLRAVSSFLVTEYHPDVIWLSNTLLYLVGIIYLYTLVGLLDRYYGDYIFKKDNRLMETLRPILRKIIRVLILVIAGLHVYNDLTGRTAVSVLAGLGIGGIALALASQETLKNLLGFAAIALDKTFYVGDTVRIDEFEGTVEHVGIRSLRLRTYEGRSVVIPNSTAMGTNIVNLNRAPYMRREMLLRLHPNNPGPKVEEALAIMRDVLDGHDGKIPGLPPVVRFSEYEPARFVLQGMFWYDAGKPFFYDEASRINLEVAKRFSAAGIVFAER